jgi:long-chain acyl-CoA synthetase
VDELANGLLAIGVRKGDSFGILAQTTLEWALFDFALGLIGAVGAAIYANSSPKDCCYVLEHSDAVGVLVEDEDQRAKVAGLGLEHVISFAELDELRARGRDHAASHPRALREAEAAVGEDHLFTFIYTSGTTGPPKACMIRHRNYYAMAAVVDEIDDFTMADDTMLLYLPLAHNFGRLMHLQGPYVGFTLAFLPDPMRAAEALKAVKPTLFPSVPRVFEKVHTAVLAKFDEETGAKRKIVDWALDVGRKASERRAAGKPLGALLGAQHRLADRLVYSKVKANLGGNFRIGISGGAPLAKEIAEFFHSLDVLILEGYGLTECTTAASVNRPSRFRFGTVGPALPGTELRIADDGEVMIKSPTVFAGYYKDEEATREILADDGWLRSGDIGELDEDGFLSITDRKKDIIVTAGGKNVAPQNLENELKASKYVSQALVVGDNRPYCIALITLDEPELVKWAHARGLKGELSLAALSQRDEVRDLVQPIVEHVNAEHSRYEQIKKFTILERDFTMADDEVTPTLKLKRRVAQDHFAGEIDALYGD